MAMETAVTADGGGDRVDNQERLEYNAKISDLRTQEYPMLDGNAARVSMAI